MDIDKELEDIFNDPLMDVSYQEAKLFDVPADMKGVIRRRMCQTMWRKENCVKISHSLSLSSNRCIRI